MKHSDLLRTARDLTEANTRRPRQADLRRAISTTYYALFHCLARNCADMVAGGTGASRSGFAWRQAYRALQHGTVKDRCKNSRIMQEFPADIRRFAAAFVNMQGKRELADYDPYAEFNKSDVIRDIDEAERVIERFLRASAKHRRAFAIYVLLYLRKHPTI